MLSDLKPTFMTTELPPPDMNTPLWKKPHYGLCDRHRIEIHKQRIDPKIRNNRGKIICACAEELLYSILKAGTSDISPAASSK
ncbi:hypothetical protein EVAR_101689_1 [Eumeta japonica]|uniref:Uncharacterized protein n=1 Tax=Eumeta variegata TaxID=151549 RepID=A0A4C1SHH9_EUMVA|nr:hypothetical protein EVAR_101689_1 [Eumeta japonica]